MVSGSSDCSVCVWDLHLGALIESNDDDISFIEGGGNSSTRAVRDEGEREVRAEVKAVLKGHLDGVLDLRIDRHWIVSW